MAASGFGNPRYGRLGSLRHSAASLRGENLLALNFFHVHATMMSPLPISQNPTVGF
jgi:hypothetical protein